ncbi:uncharacterized protein LOC144176030 [Haemaphysalis longicornis]
MDTEPQLEAQGSTGSSHQRHCGAAEDLRGVVAPAFPSCWQPILCHCPSAAAAADAQDQKGAPGRSLPMKAGFTSARRCGCTVKVQPTSIARRRPGVNRGPGRVPAGQELG